MKLKRTDLELLMNYLTKEKPEFVDVSISDEAFKGAISFNFKDVENRDCTIRIFSADSKTTPDLIKVMKLYTRMKGLSIVATEEGKKEE